MKNLFLFLTLMLSLLVTMAQYNNPMETLRPFEGRWKGNAWIMLGPGSEKNLEQHENVQFKLKENILMIEGSGFENGEQVFAALAIINYNMYTKQYEMRAIRDNGQATNAYFKVVNEKEFEWGFDIPNGGKIKYAIDFTNEGKWHEVGHYSPDGQTWYKNLEMTLTKQ